MNDYKRLKEIAIELAQMKEQAIKILGEEKYTKMLEQYYKAEIGAIDTGGRRIPYPENPKFIMAIALDKILSDLRVFFDRTKEQNVKEMNT
ncbi:MAG: hypothetical protein QW582_01665 [Candidatus Micrarchaeaceae archaeon]